MDLNRRRFFDFFIPFSHLGVVQFLLLPEAFFELNNFWVEYILPANLFLCMFLYFYFFYDVCARKEMKSNRVLWIVFFIMLFFVAPIFYYYCEYRKEQLN